MPDIVWVVLIGLLAIVCVGWTWADMQNGRKP
jgi:nicotinamidase-related amidase